jgi:hypothetical protein
VRELQEQLKAQGIEISSVAARRDLQRTAPWGGDEQLEKRAGLPADVLTQLLG